MPAVKHNSGLARVIHQKLTEHPGRVWTSEELAKEIGVQENVGSVASALNKMSKGGYAKQFDGKPSYPGVVHVGHATYSYGEPSEPTPGEKDMMIVETIGELKDGTVLVRDNEDGTIYKLEVL
jgi:hypothetical protein